MADKSHRRAVADPSHASLIEVCHEYLIRQITLVNAGRRICNRPECFFVKVTDIIGDSGAIDPIVSAAKQQIAICQIGVEQDVRQKGQSEFGQPLYRNRAGNQV